MARFMRAIDTRVAKRDKNWGRGWRYSCNAKGNYLQWGGDIMNNLTTNNLDYIQKAYGTLACRQAKEAMLGEYNTNFPSEWLKQSCDCFGSYAYSVSEEATNGLGKWLIAKCNHCGKESHIAFVAES